MGRGLACALGLAALAAGALAAAPEALAAGAAVGAPETLRNRLAEEASPFLRAHAEDPIAWQPYGDAAFAAAAGLERPVFVHVGFASCSGCLTMATESFRDPAVADALNAGFVPVMLDRDAEPEAAEAYARIAAEMGERVGFPLHVFLLPDGSPIHVATFLPRQDRPGQPGILTVLASVARALESGADPLARRGEALGRAIAEQLVVATPPATDAPRRADVARAAAAWVEASDPEWGGRARLPKRPSEPPVALLLRHARQSGEGRALETALRGLERMREAPIRGGDGGFHEGAAQRDWSEPLADRRLGDNALVALAALEAWQASGQSELRDLARGTLDFLIAQMRTPDGAFVATFAATGRGTLVPTGGNGLALSALARGGFALAEPRFVEAARSAARFALARLDAPGGLVAFVADGRSGPPATLADHALLIAGLLDLLEADADPTWLEAAFRLQAAQEARLAHPDGGYFLTQGTTPGLPRPRHARDGALPSGQGAAASNLLRLHALSGEADFRARAERLLEAFGAALRSEPLAHATLAVALDAQLEGLREIVVVTAGDAVGEALVDTLRRAFVPGRVLLVVRDGAAPAPLVARAPLLAGKRALGGASTAFVCRDHVCAHPARDVATLRAQLAAR